VSALPTLFEGTTFVMPDERAVEQLSVGERERLYALRDAVSEQSAVEAECIELEETITTVLGQMAEFQEYIRENFPKPTFHDLWQASKRI
jgi:hypothetical protein